MRDLFTEEDDSDEDDSGMQEEEEARDVAGDFLFAERDQLFDGYGDDDFPEDQEQDEGDMELPPAFYEHPAIRNAYVRAFVACAFEGVTHRGAQLMLEGSALCLRSMVTDVPDLEVPGLDDMARTLSTAEKRLGLSTEGLITYLFVCDVCWNTHHPRELYDLEGPACIDPECNGQLYTSRVGSNGKTKRTPVKIVPYVDPQRSIAHMLMRPGKYEQLQEWRGVDDRPGERRASEQSGYEAFDDPSRPMRDVHDGWQWRAVQAGLDRRRTGRWTVEDVCVRELHTQFVALPCGLLWQINIDW